MTLTFADTHNMIFYLTKFDASEGFNQIIDFLNGSSIKYALTVNPNIYVSCIKQFWILVAVKKVNDVTRLQALVDKKKVVITEAMIRDALRLDDAEGVECLPNEEIFTDLVRNVDSSTKFYMYPRFLQLMISKQVGDLSTHTIKYSSPALTQKVFANMRRVGKDGAKVNIEDVSTVGDAAEGAASAADDEVPAAVNEPSIPSLTPPTPPPQPSQDQPSTSQGRMIFDMDADVDVTLKDVAAKDVHDVEIKESADVQGRKAESQAQIYQVDLEHADNVLSIQDVEEEPAELQKVVEVITTAKLITEVVTAASTIITAVAPQLTTASAPTLTTAPSAARRRKGVVIRDPKETATPSTIIHSKAKSKDKGKGILVEEPKPLKKQAQIEQDGAYARELEAELNKNIDWDETEDQARKNMMIYLRNVAGFKMDYFKGMTYDDIRPIFEKYFNSNKLNEEVKELRRHLQIVPNDEDDVYTEATPLALKVPVVYKIKRADGSHQLYLSFLSMLRNFDREELEVLWQLVKERFASTKPKNFSDDFLLTTLGAMFEKLDIQA
nr:hypothetical protein [Tanacetum cinerariifolium]